jgi:Sulfotransferase family
MIGDLKDRELVFLVGCARSGTTWLQLLLSQHARVSTSQETNLFSVYMGPLWSSWQDEISNQRLTGLNKVLGQDAFLDLCRRFSAAVLERFPRVSGEETIILEKTPSHVFHAELILQLFPRARFIHLVRDPRAVAASLLAASRSLRNDWAPRTAVNCARLWHRSISAGHEISKLTQRSIEVKYESLLAAPVETLNELFEFMRLERDDALCRKAFEACSIQGLKDAHPALRAPESIRSVLPGVVRNGSADGWRDELGWLQVAAIESIASSEMSRYQYEPASSPLQRRLCSLARRTKKGVKNWIARRAPRPTRSWWGNIRRAL